MFFTQLHAMRAVGFFMDIELTFLDFFVQRLAKKKREKTAQRVPGSDSSSSANAAQPAARERESERKRKRGVVRERSKEFASTG